MKVAVLVAALACFLAACLPPPSSPRAHASNATELVDKTIGIAGVDEDGDVLLHCAGVWVGMTEIATATHCLQETPKGDVVAYITRDDVLDADGRLRDEPRLRMARVLAVDEKDDVALLQAESMPAHGIAQLRLDALEVGEPVRAVGHPLGLWFSFSAGHVAAMRYAGDTLIVQSTAPISPGNSGGPLFDEDGRLVAIADRVRRNEDGFAQNLNLFVSVRHVAALMQHP